MIYDAFCYSGEKQLLEIRINELSLCNDWVTHVVVESNKTFSGLDKPLYFEENKTQFSQYKNIMHLVVNDMPEDCDTWTREKFQRNKIMLALNFLDPKDDDKIIISDVDEVPRAKQVNKFKTEIEFAALVMDKYSYFLNCFEGKQTWNRARIMSWKYLKDKSPEEVRNSGYDFALLDAGWHWSWMGGVEEMIRKVNSFSHQEYNTPEFKDEKTLASKMETGQCLWNDNDWDKWKFVDIDLSYPEYIFKNQDKFKNLIK